MEVIKKIFFYIYSYYHISINVYYIDLKMFHERINRTTTTTIIIIIIIYDIWYIVKIIYIYGLFLILIY